MHVYIKMRMESSSPAVPIHYNYLIQSALYAALPADKAIRFHDGGFPAGSRNLKLFSFSRLSGKYVLDGVAGTIFFPEGAILTVTSPVTDFFLSLINSLLTRNSLRLGKSIFHVEEVRFEEQKVEGEVLTVRTLSPVVVYSTLLRPEGGKYTCYYQPGEKEFDKLITTNLVKKYEAFHGIKAPEGEIRVRTLDRPRLHVTNYKGTLVKGYTCRLKLQGPRELLQMALNAGLGGKGSQGYGCVEKVVRREILPK
ncbi:MAG TPA: CRISPR-associated endoribonuclease Cas6 [Clostridia bacterium]|nr:CRISPR-associated endoribonuclease Cas6 [Clostridia bacterium]